MIKSRTEITRTPLKHFCTHPVGLRGPGEPNIKDVRTGITRLPCTMACKVITPPMWRQMLPSRPDLGSATVCDDQDIPSLNIPPRSIPRDASIHFLRNYYDLVHSATISWRMNSLQYKTTHSSLRVLSAAIYSSILEPYYKPWESL